MLEGALTSVWVPAAQAFENLVKFPEVQVVLNLFILGISAGRSELVRLLLSQ